MSTLLHIDSSPLGGKASFSRELTAEFVSRWRQAHPDGKVITRDLSTTQLPQLTAAWITAANTAEASLTPEQREALAISDQLIAELHEADEYVFGVPMHNFSIPSGLKLWIDQVARSGKTFTYANGTPSGLLRNKKATFFVATGGVYEAGTPSAAFNFVEPYLKSLFGFIGVTDTRFISASGTGKVMYGIDRETILRPALDVVRAQFQTA